MVSIDELIDRSKRLRDTVIRLHRDVSQHEQRTELRRPFFQPVNVSVAGDSSMYAAVARDLSTHGVSLLHTKPLPCGEMTLIITTQSGEQVRLRGAINWCDPFGEEWYISGGKLIDVVGDE